MVCSPISTCAHPETCPCTEHSIIQEKGKAISLSPFFVSCVLRLERAKHQQSLISLYFQKLAFTEIEGKTVLDIASVQKKKPATNTCNKNPKTYMILYRHITPETSPRTAIVFKYKSSAYISKAASGCLTWVNFISFLALPGGQLKVIPD